MFISVEQTVTQTLPASVVDSVNEITLTHLNSHSLIESVNAVKRINDSAGRSLVIPHIAARNIKSEAELLNACQAFKQEKVMCVLVIGGNQKSSNYYSSVYEVCRLINPFGFRKLCGVYPQTESFQSVKRKKYKTFSEGITQFCLKPLLLNQFTSSTRFGVPSQCSVSVLYQYSKRCGLLNSFKSAFENLSGVRYFSSAGFDTARFVNQLQTKKNSCVQFWKNRIHSCRAYRNTKLSFFYAR